MGVLLSDDAGAEVAFDVDVEEGGDAAYRHGCAVLCLDGSEVAEVEPLDCFTGVGGGAGDVVAVGKCHLLHLAE